MLSIKRIGWKKTSCIAREKSTARCARHTGAASVMQSNTGSLPMPEREDLWPGQRPLECRRGEASPQALMRWGRCVPDAAPTSAEHVCVAAGSMGLALLQRAWGL
jgi:hypothetical protein